MEMGLGLSFSPFSPQHYSAVPSSRFARFSSRNPSGEIREFGNASTAFGLGGLVGAILTYFMATKFVKKAPGLFGLAMGILVIGVGLNRSLPVLLLFMIVGGILLTMANISANSNVQLKATNSVRGRYSSLYQLALRGGMALGGSQLALSPLFRGRKALLIEWIIGHRTPLILTAENCKEFIPFSSHQLRKKYPR